MGSGISGAWRCEAQAPPDPPDEGFWPSSPSDRFERARRDGLTAEQAAQAVGVPRSNLRRWAKESEPKSRRPHQVKQRSWPSAPIRAVERLRLDFPMWGRAKARAARARKASQSRTWRYEFYETYDLPSTVEALNPILDSFQHLYNHHRPHGALAGQTPAACLAKRQAAEIAPSHIT